MPAAANIRGLVGFLGDRRNLVITVKTREKPVDVNFAPAFGKSDMLVRCDVLITQENKSVFNEGRTQFVKCAGIYSSFDVDIMNFNADAPRHRYNFNLPHERLQNTRLRLGQT